MGFSQGRKNAGTMRANAACSDGIAAIGLPLPSATLYEWTKPLNPRWRKPRAGSRWSGSISWYFCATIHGGAVGSTTNITQPTSSTVAKRFMNRTHWRWLTTHSTARAITGKTKWL